VNAPTVFTTSLLKTWLDSLGVEHYICGECAGLHLQSLQALGGVIESRLFIEEWGLLVSTEFQIRPSALLPLVAELGQLNGGFPTLKLFLDIVDEAMPQLVAGTTVLTGAGLSEAQFALFISSTMEMVSELGNDLRVMECLPVEDSGEDAPPQLH